MSLDVIVVNYQSPSDLAEFLHSYSEHPPEQRATLHVVNVLPGERDRALVGHKPGVVSYDINEPMDFGRAANIAGNNGKLETVAVFNADTVLTEGLLDGVSDLLWSDPEYGVLGPRQVDEANRFTHAGVFGVPTEPKHRGWLNPDKGQFSRVDEAIMVSGSALFMRRSLWKELTDCPLYREACPDAIGPIMESHYYSDTWLCYHARAHGKKVIYDGSHVMTHKWHRSTELGGYAETSMASFRAEYRRLCDIHGIEHE